MVFEAEGSSETATSALAREPMHQLGHLPRMVLIHGHDQAARIRLLLLPQTLQFGMGIAQHRPQPGLLEQGGLEALRWRSNVNPSSNVA